MKYLIILFALFFIGCDTIAGNVEFKEEGKEEGIAWYSDYPVSATYAIGKVFYAGKDTLLYIDDPVITYRSDKFIKTGKVTVFHKGIGYNVDCTVRAYEIRVFNDVLYGAGPDIVFLPTDIVRFEVVAETWGDE